RHLVLPLEDDASPCSPAGRQGGASSPRGKTRRCLIPSQEDEASPRSPAERRGSTSFPRRKMRRHLVPAVSRAYLILPLPKSCGTHACSSAKVSLPSILTTEKMGQKKQFQSDPQATAQANIL
ncbi:hypothetical protein B296_00033855, partial [Ensete ventricosum]